MILTRTAVTEFIYAAITDCNPVWQRMCFAYMDHNLVWRRMCFACMDCNLTVPVPSLNEEGAMWKNR